MAAEGEDVLLAPDTDFIMDDQCCHQSGMEVSDRLTYLEQRVHMQDDEIQLLKMTMCDVLKRLNISEQQTAAPAKRNSVKAARPMSLVLSSRASSSTSVSSLRKSSTLPASPKNYKPSSTAGRSPAGGNVKESASSKKLLQTKLKENSSAGTRRVTQCKVTMQIYLSPLSRKTGRTDITLQASEEEKSRLCRVLLKKSPCENLRSPQPKNTISQYFQICY